MQRLWTICIVAILASAPSLAVNVAFPPTTDTYPHNCQVVPYVTFGADGGVVYFIRGDFFTNINTGTEYFAGCEPTGGGMGMQFAPAASGVAVTIHAFLDSDINVSASAGTTTYHVSAGNSIGVSIPGPTSGVGFTAQTPLSAFSVESLSVGSQIANTTPGDIQFDITDTTPADDRRVLLSNLHHSPGTTMPQFPYPLYQGRLAKDAAIPIDLRILYGGVGTSGVPVTLRIIDPPDPSEYIVGTANWQGQPVPGATLSHAGDNVGPPPTFHGNCIPCATYSVTSGANGTITAELDLDPHTRAGDNYQVEATARFPNGTTKTVRSGVITVWKRMFVEKKPMFRAGAPLATDAPAGATRLIVKRDPIASAGATAFRRDDSVMLLHAPFFGTAKTPSGYYSGLYRITRLQRFRAQTPAVGPGTVETHGTATIDGNGTHFIRDFEVGDVITVGADRRVVVDLISNTQMTVHAPTTSASANQAYTIGDRNLVANTDYYRLALDRPLSESYYREPLANSLTGTVTANDAAVRVPSGGVTPADVFDVPAINAQLAGTATSQWSNAFASAYTEYVVLPATLPIGAAGAVAPRVVLSSSVTAKPTQQFIDKWLSLPSPVPLPSTSPDPMDGFRYLIPPNHQLVLVGDTNNNDITQSDANGFLSIAVQHERASVLDRGTIEYAVRTDTKPLYGADPDTVLQRTAVHELTHQWYVNFLAFGARYSDHCFPEVAYVSAAAYPAVAPGTTISLPVGLEFCLMSYTADAPTMLAPWSPHPTVNMVEYLYRRGLTHFHMAHLSTGWNSEYLSIRNTPDPWMP